MANNNILSPTSNLLLDAGSDNDDDSSNAFEQARTPNYLSPSQKLLQSLPQPKEKDVKPFSVLGTLSSSFETAKEITKDIIGGAIETPRQIVGGVGDALQEIVDLSKDLSTSIGGALSDIGIPSVVKFVDDEGNFDFDLLTQEQAKKIGFDPQEKAGLPKADDPRTISGGLVRGISQFLTGFIPAVKGAKAAGITSKTAQTLTAGAVADAAVFDPLEARLSNLIEEHPELSNPVTRFLQSDPDDSKAEGRFKNAIEGMALGGVTELFAKGVGIVRKAIIFKNKAKALEADKEAATKLSKSTEFKTDEFKVGEVDGEGHVVKELTPIGRKLEDKISADFEGTVKEYNANPESKGGKILSSDTAKELSDDFNKDRSLASEVHDPARDFIKKRFEQVLKTPPKKGEEPVIMFTAGGSGAGKSVSLDDFGDVSKIQAVMDGNLSKIESAIDKINKTVEAGKDASIVFTYRDPVEAFENGVLKRTISQAKKFGSGRIVPIEDHIRTHRDSAEVLRQLSKEFKDTPNVTINVIDNSKGKGQATLGDLDTLAKADYAKAEKEILEIMRKAHGAGKITDQAKRAFEGDVSAAKKISGDDTGIDSKPEQERFSGQVETPPIRLNAADPKSARNINLNNLNTTDDVKALIDDVAVTDSTKINEARREQITFDETEKLADELGMTVKDLLDRRRGQAFNAEQAVASRKILVASGENLFNLADVAKNGSESDLIIFRKAFSQHQAIQKQVSGLTAEAGRALSSFRIQASSVKGQQRAIKEALESGGGEKFSRDLADKMSELKTSQQINTFVDQAAKATKPEMIYEAWINALLSSPATHVVNILSNSIVSGVAIGERKIAQLIGAARGSNDSVVLGEATSQFKGMIEGAKDGIKLAYGVIKTGDPTDPLQKIEAQKFKSITAENLNLTGVAGTMANFVGETVRLPGRFLSAGDELFKTMGYRMELNAQAFRTASQEGLEGKEMAERVQSLITSPPEWLHLEAIDAGRYQTFTKQLGDAGQVVQKAREKLWGAKVIMPFIRTPTNIIKYVGERTPLAPLSKAVRAEFAAGGARKDLALAKIAMGSTLMAISADMAMSGDITGAGPANFQLKRMLRETGWQPYSVKIGDEYFSYSRLDPIGAFIGLSADMTEIIGHADEQDVLDIATAATLATAQNVTSKTYLRGVAEFFDMMSSTSSEVGAKNSKQKRWLTRLAGTVIPSGVAALERVVSPELSATYGVMDQIASRIPGLSKDLPPRRNVFGDPIVLQGGLGPDILSPIYVSKIKKDAVVDEIVAQQAIINMPQKTIRGVQLTPEQYDRYVVLASGKDNNGVKRVPVKRKLAEVFRTGMYKKATDGSEGSKALIIQNIFSGYKQAAQAQMLKEFPELKRDIKSQLVEKRFNLTGK